MQRLKLERTVGFCPEELGNAATAAAYADFAPYVRGRLAELGVRNADLSDLCHEVFLIVHDRAELLPQIARVDLWLRAICRRVAAAYRRRAGNQHELLGCNPEIVPSPVTDPDEGTDVDHRRLLALVRQALHRLDDESRDLIALADAGQIPLTDLAKLVDHDRKTVRKRLDRARRRVSRLVCEDNPNHRTSSGAAAPRITPPGSPLMRAQAERGREAGCGAEDLEVLHLSSGRNVGVIGNVAIANWWGAISTEKIDSIFQVAPRALERCGGEFVYLAVMEPDFEPPSLAARQRIVEVLEVVGPYLNAFAMVLLKRTAAIAAPIISGLMLLARPRFPMRAFSGIDKAATWLCDTYAHGPRGPLAATDLVPAVERLRAFRPKT